MSLYSWSNKNDELARSIAMGLKGGGPAEIYDYYAQKICERRMLFTRQKPNEEFIFIPAPGKVRNKRDHAEQLAAAVAKIFQGRFCQALERVSIREQKNKSEMERRAEGQTVKLRADFDWSTISAKDDQLTKTVFVDDIITTGKTAHSAHLALGKPKNFEIWTIFNRIRLRP